MKHLHKNGSTPSPVAGSINSSCTGVTYITDVFGGFAYESSKLFVFNFNEAGINVTKGLHAGTLLIYAALGCDTHLRQRVEPRRVEPRRMQGAWHWCCTGFHRNPTAAATA